MELLANQKEAGQERQEQKTYRSNRHNNDESNLHDCPSQAEPLVQHGFCHPNFWVYNGVHENQFRHKSLINF